MLSLSSEGEDEGFIIIGEKEPNDAVVTWSSSDETVATVTDEGVVHAVGEGTATITASIDGASDTCSVTVSA